MEKKVAEKTKSNTGAFVAIGILATVVVGLAVALIIVLVTGCNCEKCDKESGKSESNEELLNSLEISRRNTVREDDIATFITEANNYMVNNSGKIPFTDAATINKFTIRYIDSRCTELNGILVNCGSDFMDPNGVQYSWANLGSREKITAGDVDYKIYYKTYAACNDEGDGVVERSSQREFALLMKLEGGKVSCNDNR